PQVVKAVKNLSQEGYFDKRRNEQDERTVLILINDQQRKKIDELLSRVNETIKSTDVKPQ
ncbi:transcriptional regulator, partial [Staphylococcus felis]|nr:transcriptional regulator [Staphylococcus felis]